MRSVIPARAAAAATVFLGSYLLFQIQPLLGRTLLPVFGGGASVWCVCLAAFQVLLVAGYLYAHALTAGCARSGGGVRRGVHVAALAGAGVWLWSVAVWRVPLLGWLSGLTAGPLAVLAGVALFVTVPYVALAAGSTYVQALEEGRRQGKDAYTLYAVSNVGSLLGLLAYPFVLEPFVSLRAQWYLLAVGFCVYGCAVSALRPEAGPVREAAEPPELGAGVPRGRAALWLLLPGAGVFLLNAVTAHLMVDVTPMPLLWVALLAAYLLSYVVGFLPGQVRWRRVWCVLALAALAGATVARRHWGAGSFLPNAVSGMAVLLAAGAALHGWLYDLRPARGGGLGRFYLFVAVGGAVGGLLASVATPLLTDRVAEYPLALALGVFLAAARLPSGRAEARTRWGAGAACCAAWAVLAVLTVRPSNGRAVFRARSFYGCLTVTRTLEAHAGAGIYPVHYLWFGQTTHGVQSFAPGMRGEPVSYYGPAGGGLAILSHPRYAAGQPLRVGVVGLGTGTLACYGRPGDLYRFFEINPQVVQVATSSGLFTYLPDTRAAVDLVEGDARRMLELERKARDPHYHVLVVDAYSGDAVPYHLATREAFALYLDRLEEDGVLALHVSNWHIDLLPLCKAVAQELGVCAYGVVTVGKGGLTADSLWVLFTRRPQAFRHEEGRWTHRIDWTTIRACPIPTDEKGSLIGLIRPPWL